MTAAADILLHTCHKGHRAIIYPGTTADVLCPACEAESRFADFMRRAEAKIRLAEFKLRKAEAREAELKAEIAWMQDKVEGLVGAMEMGVT